MDAVGFTFSGLFGNMVDDILTVTYYGSGNNELLQQTFTHTDSTTNATAVAAFSGYLNEAGDALANVSYLTISYTGGPDGSMLSGLDDIGFSAAIGVVAMLRYRRRRA